MGGSGGSSSGSSKTQAATLNPASIIFGEALGLKGSTRKGGLGFTGDPMASGLGFTSGRLIGPEAFQPLGGLFNPQSGSGLDIDNTAGFFGREAANLYRDVLGPGVRDLAATGFKTDIQPAVDLSSFLFRNEFLPAAAEQFGQFGLNPRDSDFGSAVAREASRRSAELGALDIELSEAAAGRRAAGIPMAAQFPTGFADLLYGFDESTRRAQLAQSDAGQVFSLLAQLGGINTQGQGVGTSSQSSRQFGFNLL